MSACQMHPQREAGFGRLLKGVRLAAVEPSVDGLLVLVLVLVLMLVLVLVLVFAPSPSRAAASRL